MSRERMVEKATRVLWDAAWPRQTWESASEDDHGSHLDDAQAVVDAILPQVTTVAELEALPVGTKLIGANGESVTVDEDDRAPDFRFLTDGEHWAAPGIIREFGPLAVWLP